MTWMLKSDSGERCTEGELVFGSVVQRRSEDEDEDEDDRGSPLKGRLSRA